MYNLGFKKWLLKEGAYLEFQKPFSIQGKPVAAIDMRFEDWNIDAGEDLAQKASPPIGNFFAKIGKMYIVYTMGRYAKVSQGLTPTEANYAMLPKGWEKYAEFYGPGNNGNEIIKPAKYDAYKRLTSVS
jgi:hypothetical protein